jgi:hypothetical protein
LIVQRQTAIQHFRARAFLAAEGGDEPIGILHDFHAIHFGITGDASEGKVSVKRMANRCFDGDTIVSKESSIRGFALLIAVQDSKPTHFPA